MAKFKTNHRNQRRDIFSGYLKLLFIFALLVVLALFSRPAVMHWLTAIDSRSPDHPDDLFYLPAPTGDSIYRYQGFTLAYEEDKEQARWTAYELTVNHLNAPKVARTDYYREDLNIRSGSATYYDYKNSGLTKGHLVPAADRAYSVETMEETFLMSNISPQVYLFNVGIWRELEEQTRDWARKSKSLYIVTGPVFDQKSLDRIGQNQVAVPQSFFKVILDHIEPELKGIAFIIPNEPSVKHLDQYVFSIDEVEQKTELDFFHELFTNKLEDSLERKVDQEKWSFNEERYQMRINQWNKR